MSTALALALVLALVLVVYMVKTSGRRRGGCPDTPCPEGTTCYRSDGGLATCVQCGVPADCPAGGPSACVNNMCGCVQDGDCPSGARCSKGACVPRRLGACETHADCGPQGACVEGRCVPFAGRAPRP